MNMIIMGTLKACKNVNLPYEVEKSLQNNIPIFDEDYDANLDIIKNLGGYVIIAETVEDIEKINNEIIKGIVQEDLEQIKYGDGQVYCSSPYLLGFKPVTL